MKFDKNPELLSDHERKITDIVEMAVESVDSLGLFLLQFLFFTFFLLLILVFVSSSKQQTNTFQKIFYICSKITEKRSLFEMLCTS